MSKRTSDRILTELIPLSFTSWLVSDSYRAEEQKWESDYMWFLCKGGSNNCEASNIIIIIIIWPQWLWQGQSATALKVYLPHQSVRTGKACWRWNVFDNIKDLKLLFSTRHTMTCMTHSLHLQQIMCLFSKLANVLSLFDVHKTCYVKHLKAKWRMSHTINSSSDQISCCCFQRGSDDFFILLNNRLWSKEVKFIKYFPTKPILMNFNESSCPTDFCICKTHNIKYNTIEIAVEVILMCKADISYVSLLKWDYQCRTAQLTNITLTFMTWIYSNYVE